MQQATTATDFIAALLRRAQRNDRHQRYHHRSVTTAGLSIEALFPTKSSSSSSPCAVTNQCAWSREIQETEFILHQHQDQHHRCSSSLDPAIRACSASKNEMETVLRDLADVYARHAGHRVCLSQAEQHYAHAIERVAVAALTKALLHHQNGAEKTPLLDPEPFSTSNVHEWLLEQAVQPTSASRELAFTMLLHLVTAVNVVSLAPCTKSNSRDVLPTTASTLTQLFTVFIDMLIKAVVVAGTSSYPEEEEEDRHLMDAATTNSAHSCEDACSIPVWVLRAVTCLKTFIKLGDSYRGDRLAKLTPPLCVFLLHHAYAPGYGWADTTDSSTLSALQHDVLELTICALYADAQRRLEKAERTARRASPRLILSRADVDRFGGVAFFLTVFYFTPCDRSRQLLLVVFFDLTLEQMLANKSVDDHVIDCLVQFEPLLVGMQREGLASYVATNPLVLMDTTRAELTSLLLAWIPRGSTLHEKHVHAFVETFRDVLQITEYFTHSEALKEMVAIPSTTSSGSVAETAVAKASGLLTSKRIEVVARGERWLAELLLYGMEDESPSESLLGDGEKLSQSAPVASEALEETFCFDAGNDIRLTARAELWELLKSPSASARKSAASILINFSKRRVQLPIHTSSLSRHLRELNICLHVFVVEDEDEVAVLAMLLHHLVSFSIRPLSYMDQKEQEYDCLVDGSRQELVGIIFSSDSLASRILAGEFAIDPAVTSQISFQFLLHCLAAFNSALHPHRRCRGGCCGIVFSIEGDLMVVVALILTQVIEHFPLHLHDAGGLEVLLPFLDACDTRVAIIIATSLNTQLKHLHGTLRYNDMLRKMHTIAVEEDDETLLSNEYAHARALLHYLEQAPPVHAAAVP